MSIIFEMGDFVGRLSSLGSLLGLDWLNEIMNFFVKELTGQTSESGITLATKTLSHFKLCEENVKSQLEDDNLWRKSDNYQGWPNFLKQCVKFCLSHSSVFNDRLFSELEENEKIPNQIRDPFSTVPDWKSLKETRDTLKWCEDGISRLREYNLKLEKCTSFEILGTKLPPLVKKEKKSSKKCDEEKEFAKAHAAHSKESLQYILDLVLRSPHPDQTIIDEIRRCIETPEQSCKFPLSISTFQGKPRIPSSKSIFWKGLEESIWTDIEYSKFHISVKQGDERFDFWKNEVTEKQECISNLRDFEGHLWKEIQSHGTQKLDSKNLTGVRSLIADAPGTVFWTKNDACKDVFDLVRAIAKRWIVDPLLFGFTEVIFSLDRVDLAREFPLKRATQEKRGSHKPQYPIDWDTPLSRIGSYDSITKSNILKKVVEFVGFHRKLIFKGSQRLLIAGLEGSDGIYFLSKFMFCALRQKLRHLESDSLMFALCHITRCEKIFIRVDDTDCKVLSLLTCCERNGIVLWTRDNVLIDPNVLLEELCKKYDCSDRKRVAELFVSLYFFTGEDHQPSFHKVTKLNFFGHFDEFLKMENIYGLSCVEQNQIDGKMRLNPLLFQSILILTYLHANIKFCCGELPLDFFCNFMGNEFSSEQLNVLHQKLRDYTLFRVKKLSQECQSLLHFEQFNLHYLRTNFIFRIFTNYTGVLGLKGSDMLVNGWTDSPDGVVIQFDTQERYDEHQRRLKLFAIGYCTCQSKSNCCLNRCKKCFSLHKPCDTMRGCNCGDLCQNPHNTLGFCNLIDFQNYQFVCPKHPSFGDVVSFNDLENLHVTDAQRLDIKKKLRKGSIGGKSRWKQTLLTGKKRRASNDFVTPVPNKKQKKEIQGNVKLKQTKLFGRTKKFNQSKPPSKSNFFIFLSSVHFFLCEKSFLKLLRFLIALYTKLPNNCRKKITSFSRGRNPVFVKSKPFFGG